MICFGVNAQGLFVEAKPKAWKMHTTAQAILSFTPNSPYPTDIMAQRRGLDALRPAVVIALYNFYFIYNDFITLFHAVILYTLVGEL